MDTRQLIEDAKKLIKSWSDPETKEKRERDTQRQQIKEEKISDTGL